MLLALAAAGHMLQRYLGLPKVLGYCVVGALAGFSGFTGASWPPEGIGLFLVELGLSVMLFEAGGRLTFRWRRYNPMLLIQSLAEFITTFAAVCGVLRVMAVEAELLAPLSLLATAASPTVLMRVATDLRASGPVTERSIALASLNTLYVLPLGGVMARYLGEAQLSLAGVAYPVLVLLGTSVAFGAVLALALRITLATNFGGSAPLAALLAGILLKAVHPRHWSWPRQFGTAASILTILMLVLVAMSAVALLLVSQFSVFAPVIGTQVAAFALPLILMMELLGALMCALALQRSGEVSETSLHCRRRRLMCRGKTRLSTRRA